MEPVKSTVNREEESLAKDLEEDRNTKKRQMQEDALEEYAHEICKQFSQYIADKEPVERRMIQCYTQYHGQYYREEEYGFNEFPPSTFNRTPMSRIFVNITRSKTDSAEARLSDMLFPSDDRNWDILPTPVPEVSEALKNTKTLQLQGQDVMKPSTPGQEPQPMTEGDLASAQIEEAATRADKMRKEIDDQLTECNYAIEARKAIRDGVMLGTGILKGPMQIGRTRRVWVPKMGGNDKEIHMLEVQEVVKPYVYRVDPWNFFPDMSVSDIKDCEATFEIHYKTAKQLKEYMKTPGFMEPQVRKVLQKQAKETHVRDHTQYLEQKRAIAGLTYGTFDENRYQVVERHGPVSKELLDRLGMKVDLEDPLDMYEAFTWTVGDTIIKFALHHLDSEDKLYSIFNWEKDDSNIFGYGVPYTLRAPQKVINSAWRMIMDNSGLSTGPQIAINKGVLEPADGRWELSPRKIWYALQEDLDISKAIKTFNIESHQQELLNIFHEAKKLADEESNLPMIAQGMPGTVGRTFQGMSMAMNAANIAPRRAVRNFDDCITIPLMGRMYDWNMQFNNKADIKGDFEVKALGTSSLLVKEMQSQALLALMQYINDPTFGPMFKTESLLRQAVKSMHINPDDIIKDSATIAKELKDRQEQMAQQGPQIDPNVQAKIDAQKEITMIQAGSDEQDRKLELFRIIDDREKLIAELASKEKTSADEIRAKYDIKSADLTLDEQKFYDELAVKREKGTGI